MNKNKNNNNKKKMKENYFFTKPLNGHINQNYQPQKWTEMLTASILGKKPRCFATTFQDPAYEVLVRKAFITKMQREQSLGKSPTLRIRNLQLSLS